MNKKILIFGCGNIGSRHLQGILKDKNIKKIIVVEKKKKNILIAKDRIQKIKSKSQIVKFYKNLTFKDKFFDLVILSTSNSNRLNFIKKLINKKLFQNLIIEKIAFQNVEDLKKAKILTYKKNIATWVNCTRRGLKIYRFLKKKIQSKKLKLHVKGNNWNMGSNIIHFLDLYIFLSKRTKHNFNYFAYKKNKIVESKRKGFYELKGKLKLNNSKGDEIIFEDNKNLKKDLIIKIKGKKLNILINESKLFAKINKNIINFSLPFQSNLSKFYLKKIKQNKMDLPSLEESGKSHEILFNLLKEQSKLTNKLKSKKNFYVS